jgi:hypothetical protein
MLVSLDDCILLFLFPFCTAAAADGDKEVAVNLLLSLSMHNFEMCVGDNTSLSCGVLFLTRVGEGDNLSMMILLTGCHWLGLFFSHPNNNDTRRQ